MRALLLILTLSLGLPAAGQEISGGYKAAIDKYTLQIKNNPSTAHLSTLQRGITYYLGKDYKKALDDLNLASERVDKDNRIKANYYKALCNQQLGDVHSANLNFAWVLRNLNESGKIDGIVSWEKVLEDKIGNDRKLDFAFILLNDLKTYSSVRQDDAQIKTEISNLYNVNKVFAALDVNSFRIIEPGTSRKVLQAQESFEDGNYPQTVTELSTEIQRAGPREDEMLLLRGYVYLAMGNFKAAELDLEEGARKTSSFNLKGLASFYLSFAREGNGDKAGSLAAIKTANDFFTSDKSLVPASVVQKQLLILDTPENRSALTQSSQSHSDVKEKEPLAEGKSLVATKGEHEAPATNAQEKDQKVALTEPSDPVQKLTNSIKANPGNPVPYFQRGVAYFQRGALTEALDDFLFVNKSGDSQLKNQSSYYISQCYGRMGGLEDAIRYASHLLSALQKDEKVILNIGHDEILAMRAHWRLKSGHAMEAGMDYNQLVSVPVFAANAVKILDSLKNSSPVFGFLAYDAFEYSKDRLSKRLIASRQYFLDGQFNLAIESAAADIGADPAQGMTAVLVRGFLLMMSERYGIAEKDFIQCAGSSVINQRGLAQFYLGLCYQQLGQLDNAINSLTESMKVFTSNTSLVPESTLCLKRGELFEKQGFTEMAVADYQKYLESKPGDSKVRNRSDALRKSIVTQPTIAKEERKAESPPSLRDMFKGEKRYALIIGNANYSQEIGMLANPVNDAIDLKKQLEASDFEVEILTNATFRQVDIAAKHFYEKIASGPKNQTVGLFYYSGHGLQFEGENYIVPLDATVSVPGDIRYTCFPVNRVLTNMEYANARMNIIILDACRSNALPVVNRSTEAGLAQLRAAKGSYVAFSTAPGSTASDGSGRNGLYTQELLKALNKPRLTIEQVFKEVRKNVRELSRGRQETWDNSNIIGEFYFRLD